LTLLINTTTTNNNDDDNNNNYNNDNNNDNEKKAKENGEHFRITVFYFFNAKWCRSGWENLDCGQYRFQPIKSVNLVVPSPCETEPYNNCLL